MEIAYKDPRVPHRGRVRPDRAVPLDDDPARPRAPTGREAGRPGSGVEWCSGSTPPSHGGGRGFNPHLDYYGSFGRVVQPGECRSYTPEVAGSTPAPPTFIGQWRSLVARVVRDHEAEGSSPSCPTDEIPSWCSGCTRRCGRRRPGSTPVDGTTGSLFDAPVAQWKRRRVADPEIGGSIPPGGTARSGVRRLRRLTDRTQVFGTCCGGSIPSGGTC